MAIDKTEALVLRAIKFGDTSKILTLFTREFGLMKAIAKGVRGARPKFGSALEAFARCEIVVYRRRDRDLHLIGSADLIEAHLPLGGDLKRYAFASAVVEFIPRVVSGEAAGTEAAALFDETARTIELMAASAVETLPYLLRAFQLRFVSILGHGMELHSCLSCGRRIGEEGGRGLGRGTGRLALSAGQGGLICGACVGSDAGTGSAAGTGSTAGTGSAAGTVMVSPAALVVLRAYLENDLEVAARQRLTPAVRAEIGRIMETFLTAQFDGYRGLRSLKLAASAGV